MAMLRISNTIYSFSLCYLYKTQYRQVAHALVKFELKRLLSVVSATHRRDLLGLNNAFHVQRYVLKTKGLALVLSMDCSTYPGPVPYNADS